MFDNSIGVLLGPVSDVQETKHALPMEGKEWQNAALHITAQVQYIEHILIYYYLGVGHCRLLAARQILSFIRGMGGGAKEHPDFVNIFRGCFQILPNSD